MIREFVLETILQIKGLKKSFGAQQVLKSLNLEIRKGEVVTLLGPSGCGKTTTLHIAAGLLKADAGEIFLRGAPVGHLPPQKRKVGMVFQRYALFPHMTVYENVAFGLRMMKMPSEQIRKEVYDILDVVRLPDVTHKFPSQLSGGMQQRIAFARALVMKPDILLLDEPFSNLDEKLRREMELETRRIQQAVNITTLFVTHNQEEAFVMSNRVAVMNAGQIVRIDSPREIYRDPGSRFVCSFLGDANYLEGRVTGVESDTIFIRVNDLLLEATSSSAVREGGQVAVAIRPERIKISKNESRDARNVFNGVISDVIFKGASLSYRIKVGEIVFDVDKYSQEDDLFMVNDSVYLKFDKEAVLILQIDN